MTNCHALVGMALQTEDIPSQNQFSPKMFTRLKDSDSVIGQLLLKCYTACCQSMSDVQSPQNESCESLAVGCCLSQASLLTAAEEKQ